MSSVLSIRTSSGADLHAGLWMLSLSLWVRMCIYSAHLESLIFLVSFIPSHPFFLLFCRVIWALSGRDFMETWNLEMSVAWPLTLSHSIQLWVSELSPCVAMESCSDDGQARYWSINIEIVIESHFITTLFSFFRLVLFGFTIVSWAIQSQVLSHPRSVRYGSYLVVWALIKIRYRFLMLIRFVPDLLRDT